MFRRRGWSGMVLMALALMAATAPAARADDTFLTGGDISLLARMEQLGQVYKDGGQAAPAMTILKAYGCNFMRLRTWVHPTGHDIFVNDLAYTAALGKRIKRAGFKLLLDFHYSDTWADPGHQDKPAAWQSLPFDELVQKVHDYTRDVIARMRTEGAMPDMVQPGNEIIGGMLWPEGGVKNDDFTHIAALLKAGIQGVADGAKPEPSPKIMIHIDRGGDWKATQWFFDNIQAQGVSFDIIGQSYYPLWHGPLSAARECLTNTARRYGKPVIVVETGYPNEGSPSNSNMTYPATPAGQRQFLIDLVSLVKSLPNGLGYGVNYWEPEWVPIKGLASDWGGKTLFDAEGNTLPGLAALSGLLDPNIRCQLVNSASGAAMEDADNSLKEGAAVAQNTPETGANQTWQIVSTGHGYFKIANQLTGKVLDVANSANEGAPLILTAESGSRSQEWDIVAAGGGAFKLVNRVSGKLAEAPNSSRKHGLPLDQASDTGKKGQHWRILPI